ncbi:MAG: NAD+ synthase [Bdellovibrionales bacterium]
MTDKLSLALAQLNPTVGDISGNSAKLREARALAASSGADLVVTSELFLCGYPTEDLVLKPSFQHSLHTAIERLATETADGGPGLLVGTAWSENGKLYNAAVLLDGGKIVGTSFKCDLPNYGPFDEKRLFTNAALPTPLEFRGNKLGVIICEDMWTPDCSAYLKSQDVKILIVLNGSPFEIGKAEDRHEIAADRVRETGLPLAYVNQIGGQDELVFDGASFALNAKGEAVASLHSWGEEIQILQLDKNGLSSEKKATKAHLTHAADIYHALMLGLRDYVNKSGFPGVVLGLSGGVDSALAATIAVDALGADRVWGVMLPSPYTSAESTEDAESVAKILGCKLDRLPIADAMKVFDKTLEPILGEKLLGVPQENIQSRCRGLILMALSNATGNMVLSTGNKSEMSVGYATLYGDMCGGFAVLKDVYKTQVYNVAKWRNEHKPALGLGPKGVVIPARVMTKAPTAELKPNQKDQDTLPPYDVLDGVLECLIEEDLGMHEIVCKNYAPAVVAKVWLLLDKAEYKRRQAPPGVKITPRNLSRDRRYPIINKYRERTTAR